eukprot:scaffold7477_cov21-Prasinocladus_malaysianus.AAC.1
MTKPCMPEIAYNTIHGIHQPAYIESVLLARQLRDSSFLFSSQCETLLSYRSVLSPTMSGMPISSLYLTVGISSCSGWDMQQQGAVLT